MSGQFRCVLWPRSYLEDSCRSLSGSALFPMKRRSLPWNRQHDFTTQQAIWEPIERHKMGKFLGIYAISSRAYVNSTALNPTMSGTFHVGACFEPDARPTPADTPPDTPTGWADMVMELRLLREEVAGLRQELRLIEHKPDTPATAPTAPQADQQSAAGQAPVATGSQRHSHSPSAQSQSRSRIWWQLPLGEQQGSTRGSNQVTEGRPVAFTVASLGLVADACTNLGSFAGNHSPLLDRGPPHLVRALRGRLSPTSTPCN
nr:hypothetical protein [Tanacetum cinerariifolium]